MNVLRIGWRASAYAVLVIGASILIALRWSELAGIWREHALTFAVVTVLMAIATVVQARNFTSFLPQPGGPAVLAMTRIWAIGTLANYIAPFQAGLAVRVALLARLGVPLADASIATARQIFASLWLALPVASLSLLGVNVVSMAIPSIALVAAFAAIAPCLPMLRIFAARTLNRTRAGVFAPHVERALALPTVPSAIGILVQYVLSAAVFYVGYRQFGVEITVAAAFGLACIVYASSVIVLFPGNFGVLEALVTAFGRINELPADQALALALLFRGASVTSSLLLATVLISRRSSAT